MIRCVLIFLIILITTNAVPKSIEIEISQVQSSWLKDIHFEPQKTKTDCYITCKKILNKVGLSCKDRGEEYQLILESNDNQLQKVKNYNIQGIDSMLSINHPVVVGVHHTFDYGYNEGTTDHFVVIVEKGYGKHGVYYRYFDVASKYGKSKSNKFRVLSGVLVHKNKYKNYVCTQFRYTKEA